MKTFAIAAMVLAASAAQAQWYGEVSYVGGRFKDTDLVGRPMKASPNALQLTGGYELDPSLAVEATLALGLGDDEVTGDGAAPGAKLKLERGIGLYAKPKYAINDSFEIFAKVGLQNISVKSSADAESFKTSDTKAAYGVGATYLFDKKLYVTGSYMRFASNVKGLQVGVGYKF